MKKFLNDTLFNAVCLSVFSTAYFIVFLISSKSDSFISSFNTSAGRTSFFLKIWKDALSHGYHMYIVYGLLALSIVTIIMLIKNRQKIDEYHISILKNCLTVSLIIVLILLGGFYVFTIINPSNFLAKFTFMIFIEWFVVVTADLTYITICSRNKGGHYE